MYFVGDSPTIIKIRGIERKEGGRIKDRPSHIG
jgi:hypothetical protein